MAWEVITWWHIGKALIDTSQTGLGLKIETAAIPGQSFGWGALFGAAGPVKPVDEGRSVWIGPETEHDG